jgi:predicted DNA-binding transcriptional regulator AlpA
MLGARPSRNSRKAHATKSGRTPAPSIATVPIAASDAIQLISKPELLRLLGVSYSSVFSWMRRGQFPLARELGPGGRATKIAWRADEVAAWLASRPQRQIKPLPGQTAQRLPAKNHRDKAHKTTNETNANV